MPSNLPDADTLAALRQTAEEFADQREFAEAKFVRGQLNEARYKVFQSATEFLKQHGCDAGGNKLRKNGRKIPGL